MATDFKQIAITVVKPVCKKDCPDRSFDCHGRCEKYKAYRAECDNAMQKRFQKKEFKRDVDEATWNAVKRLPGKRRF